MSNGNIILSSVYRAKTKWIFEDQITNQLTGKAKCVYEKMVKNNGNINWILENFEDKNKPSQFDLVLEMSTTLNDNVNATTEKSGNTFFIRLNKDRVENINTTLTIARTIIYEGIHARLRELSYRKGGSLSKEDFPGVYEYYRKYNKNWDHQQMADYYRQTIAKGLKHFDDAKHSDAFYDALAWEGLATELIDRNDSTGNTEFITEAWKKEPNKDEILSIIKNHKNTGSKSCK